MPTFRKIVTPRIRLADEVYRQIIEAISNGAIDPNKRIIQEKLALELEISRTPVREALLRLEQEGILEVSGSGGFVIRQISNEEVHEIYQTRAALEGHAIRLLTEMDDVKIFTQVEAIIKLEEARDLNTAAEYYDANKNIHRAFVERTNNRYLLEMFDQMWNRGFSFHLFATISDDNLKSSLGDHQQLCNTMRSGDPTKAEAAMRAHIHDGLDLQIVALAKAK